MGIQLKTPRFNILYTQQINTLESQYMTKSKNNKIIVFVCLILFFLGLGLVLRYFLSTQKTSVNINNNIITNQDINESISVAYCTDSNYIYPTIVSMTSLIENLNKNTICKFTVLVSGEVTQEEREKLITDAYQQKVADAITFGVINYFTK